MQTVGQWLEQLGLPQYTAVFARNDVDLEALRFLSESDLEKLGVSLGHRKKLLNAIAQLDMSPPPASAATASALPQPPRNEAERRQLTVMFCDLVGSTELATRLDPEHLRDLMQAYQRTCGEVIARYDGHIAQYLGDGLMVYFGWPRAHEDDVVRAIRAGLETVAAVSRLNAGTPMRARVGIHTGLVVVGETGQGDASIPKAAVGDTPNIAARLQALAEPGSVVVSERTSAMARGLFDCADLGAHALKGVSEPMRVLRVSAARTVESRFEAGRDELALTPLVGREEEIALLLRRWEQAKEGEGQVVLVGGEAGIGKSRLTRVLGERLGDKQYAVLRFQCSPYHVNSALYPVIEQFERSAGFTREDSLAQKLDKMEAMLVGNERPLAENAPLFAALLSLSAERYPALNLSPQKQKEKTLEALVGRVEALARRQPVLMIWEDVHWIDATTHETLDLQVPRLRHLPVLMLVTHRPEYSARWSDQAHVTTLGLNRLGRRQGVELASKIAGGKALPQEVLEQILSHTDGVPLFIEELSKSVLESKLLRETEERYLLDAPLPALAIPTTLRDSLIARLDRLAPIREVAQIGACIGREFGYDLLDEISPLKGTKLDDALGQLVTSGLLFKRGTPPEATYTFKHALVQDAAYDSLLKSKRIQLHAQIAEALEQQFSAIVSTQPEVVAHHYTAAEMIEQAIPYWQQAGELAHRRMALQESIAHLERGIGLIARIEAPANRHRFELNLRTAVGTGWIALRGWAHVEVERNLARAWELEQEVGSGAHVLRILWGLWVHRLCAGRERESLKFAEELLAQADKSGDTTMRLAGLWAKCLSHYFVGEFTESVRDADGVLVAFDPLRDRHLVDWLNHDAKTVALAYKACGQWMLGYADSAARLAEEALAWSRGTGHAFDLAWALHFLMIFLFHQRREPERCSPLLAEFERISAEQRLLFFEHVMAPLCRALLFLELGQAREAEAGFAAGIPRWSAAGMGSALPFWKTWHAQAAGLLGQVDQGLVLVEEALAQIRRPGWEERIVLPETLRIKGWLLGLKGDANGAEQSYRASLDRAREQQAKSWELRTATSLAQLMKDQDRHAEALQVLRPVYEWFTEGFDTKDLKEAKALLDELAVED
jgi:class 3 adenylate cyclase/tetratricopeptide (TPR) repeat protein